jgi:hypothetical protein
MREQPRCIFYANRRRQLRGPNLPLEDVLHRKRLADFFLGWATLNIHNHDSQQLIPVDEEERLAGRFDRPDAEEYAIDIMREQGRPIPPPLTTRLEPFDRDILKAVYQLRGQSSVNLERMSSGGN